jgi:uncharacterized membrane protein
MLDFLLKYSPVVYEQGQWFLRHQLSGPAVLLLLALIACFALGYRRTTSPVQRKWRVLLFGLRALSFAALVFCLLEPTLSVSTVVSQKSGVLVLVDDSESMSIPDGPSRQERIAQVRQWLGNAAQEGTISQRLQQNFRVETFRFSRNVEPLPQTEGLRAQGQSTNLGQALAFAARRAQQSALSGVVLVTDGASSAGHDPLQSARELVAARVPLFTVGVGTKIANDVQIAKVNAAPAVLENAMVEVNALLQTRGYEGARVNLELREGNAVVQRHAVTLREPSTRVSLQFTPPRTGYAKYTLSLPPQPQELVASNNQKSFLVNSRMRPGRILYVEELHPWEFKFLARALEGDAATQLTALLKTGPEKFYRLGLRDPSELAKGFPRQRTELFGFHAIVFGSMPASFFSKEQLQLVHDFVAERGGGFMMLGGMKSFAQGGYHDTPLANLLPVELPPFANTDGRAIPPQFNEEFRFTPTAEYLALPLLQMEPDPITNAQLWDKLPLLQGYNPLGPAKPGATILAVHPLHRNESPRIIMATQRYGRGRTAALATSTTWRWQMHLDHRDMTHERFWRQLVRWLSAQSPDPVTMEMERESYSPGENVTLHLEVRDSTFAPHKNANVTVKITTPEGEGVPLFASADLAAERAGDLAKYAASYEAGAEGLYYAEALAHDKQGRFLGKAESAFFVEPSQAELANADLQAPVLQRLAEITNGRYFHVSEAEALPEAIQVARSSFSKLTEHDLWDAPIFFFAIVLLLGVEWFVRRAKGLS